MMRPQFAGMTFIEHDTSISWDVLCLVLALALHAPLGFMKFNMSKKAVDIHQERLVAVDMLDEESLRKQKEAALAPPPPIEKKSGLMQKLQALVKKEPPPPPPPKKDMGAKELAMAPKAIDIKPNLTMPEKIEPKLASKSGFQTTADPNLVKEAQAKLNAGGPALAPLSAKRMGEVENRQALKSGKSGFAVGANEKISDIGGGSGIKMADASGPSIAIRTGGGGKEQFSAPAPQKADKGKFAGGSAGGLGESGGLSLRDRMIARDAAPSAIATGPRNAGGYGTGGTGEGLGATKKDAGRFQGGEVGGVAGGVRGGVVGGTLGGTGTGPVTTAAAGTGARARKTPSMFSIQGPLKDRKIVKQVVPEYPAALQAQGIEASVTLEFTVLPNGAVKNVIIVRRTSGYTKMDDSAIKALHQWKFAPLSEDENREEVGLITFNYTLS